MIRNVVLVHGAWADGSGWRAVHDLLTADGFAVSVVQHRTVTLADDAAITRRVLDQQDGQTILVGHSYGGAVITEVGTHEKVEALVYVAAFAPDKDESVNTLIADPPPGAPAPPILRIPAGQRRRTDPGCGGGLSHQGRCPRPAVLAIAIASVRVPAFSLVRMAER
jgi:pimeloyl-ACP methyl ester carboxylesterase